MKQEKDFWSYLAAQRLKDVQSSKGIRQMVANTFYQGALHMVRLIEEYELASTMKHWGFYAERCAVLERQIKTGKA